MMANDSRFFGKMCPKHPELKGERHMVNGKCSRCHLDYIAKLRSRDSHKQKKSEYRENNKDHLKELVANWCKNNRDKCNANFTKRRAAKLKAMPLWAEKDKIKVVYEKAKLYGLEVDHIVPLQNEMVCGLHVWANLQLLDKSLNASKRNRQWPDMPNHIDEFKKHVL